LAKKHFHKRHLAKGHLANRHLARLTDIWLGKQAFPQDEFCQKTIGQQTFCFADRNLGDIWKGGIWPIDIWLQTLEKETFRKLAFIYLTNRHLARHFS
jgi:hypothetical protein